MYNIYDKIMSIYHQNTYLRSKGTVLTSLVDRRMEEYRFELKEEMKMYFMDGEEAEQYIKLI